MKQKTIIIAVAVLWIFAGFKSIAQPYEERFEQRAEFVTQLTYDYGWVGEDNEYRPPGFKGYNPADFGKYVYPWMIAHYELDGLDALNSPECAKVKQYFDEGYHNKPTFHFNLVGLPRLIYRFAGVENFWKNENGGHLQDYLARVFNRNDSYNAFTGEGTENHISMSRASGYLYAQMAIDSGYGEDATGWKAAAMRDSMKYWIMEQSQRLYKTGSAEWNASTYGVYNIIGWLNLYDYARDEAVKKAARAVLDYYAAELALHYTQGITGGAEMRGGSSTQSCATGTDMLSYLWFGDCPCAQEKANFSPKTARQSVHAATSDYRPPLAAVKLAQKLVPQEPAMYYNSKGGYLYQEPSMIKETFYVSENYTLGAAYTPYGGWGGGDWQVVSWKLAARVDSAQHANAQYASGGLAWDGYIKTQLFEQPFEQVVHHKNVLIQMTRRPANYETIKGNAENIFDTWKTKWETDFDKRFPAYSKPNPVHFQDAQGAENQTVFTFSDHNTFNAIMEENLLFIELGRVYLAVRALNNSSPSALQVSGDFRWTKDAGAMGELTGLVMEIGEKQQFEDFADFRSRIINNSSLDMSSAEQGHFFYTSLKGDVLDVSYCTTGTVTEPIYDWGYGLEAQRVVHRAPPLKVPDFSNLSQAANAQWQVNAQPVVLSEDWPVYQGPHILLKDRQLTLNDSLGNVYRVDYQGDEPVFSTATGIARPKARTASCKVQLYPNPATNCVVVKSRSKDLTGAVASITDAGGRVLKRLQLSRPHKNRINISSLEPGIYAIRLQRDRFHCTLKLLIR